VLLVDESTLVVGSLALAALSLDFRREVAIAVTDPEAIAEAVRCSRRSTPLVVPRKRRRPMLRVKPCVEDAAVLAVWPPR